MRRLFILLLLLSLLQDIAPAQGRGLNQASESRNPQEMAQRVLEGRRYQLVLPGEDAPESSQARNARGTEARDGVAWTDSRRRVPTRPRRYRRGETESSGGVPFSGSSTLLIVLGVITLLTLIFIILASIRSRDRDVSLVPTESRDKTEPSSPRWTREHLDVASELARRGQYAEAIHVLLGGSLEGLNQARNVAVDPYLTSREILAAAGIIDAERAALDKLVETVEKSLFAGREVNRGDYAQCVAGYEILLESSGAGE